MSSFFRHPGDESSEGSSAEEDSIDIQSFQKTYNDVEGSVELASIKSLSTNGGISVGDSDHLHSQSALPNVQHHRDMMLATLLEEWCKTRAAELMNNVSDSGNKFYRLSPEVQDLAQKLYTEAGETLASNSFLPAAAISAERRPVRQQYLAGLDGISLRAFKERDLESITGRRALADGDASHSLALVRADRRRPSILDIMSEPFSNMIMKTGQLNISSPHSDMQLTYSRRAQSHYESSFQQVRLIGKGGFGRVYHAFNVFDRKEYAVKKIPLSSRMSQRYRESGHQELDGILREVQALAQLEHPNVVRYHTSWIEEPKRQLREQASSARHSMPIPIKTRSNPRLLENRPYQSPTSELPSSPVRSESGIQGDSIVFGHDSDSQQDVGFLTNSRSPSFRPQDGTPVRESVIFTDGQDRIVIESTDTSIDSDVYVLHVQMSIYPLTLAHYVSPGPYNSNCFSTTQIRRHCFHVIPSLKILLGIICGLRYIHSKGLIHRDIKPGNIFLSTVTNNDTLPEGFFDVGPCSSCQNADPLYLNPRIGDFGLVAELTHSGRGIAHSSPWSSELVGTEYYRPPSSPGGSDIAGYAVSEKMDVFALGVILLELLWPCETTSERMHILKDLQEGKLPQGLASKIDAEGHKAGLGAKIEGCIVTMTNKDPGRRWGCQQVKDCIEGILKQ
ncbi:hypothetical protein DV736_g3317, partial [Chaetothyriales sp. CBS 134916]